MCGSHQTLGCVRPDQCSPRELRGAVSGRRRAADLGNAYDSQCQRDATSHGHTSADVAAGVA